MNYSFLTLKERDVETGLDYSINRYYSAPQGRFTSPDEVFADQQQKNPQSWNLYTYTRNNPLRYTDPDGRGIFDFISENLQKGFNAVLFGFRVTNAELAVIVERQREFLISKTAPDGFLYVRMGEEGAVHRLDPRTMRGFEVLDMFERFNDPSSREFPLTQQIIDNAITVAGTVPPSLGPTSADQISNAHAWSKHQEEFPGWSQQKFTQKIQETIDNASGSNVRKLSNGRTAFWNEKEGMVVIRDPSSPHGGTAFRPTNGRSYFDNLQ